MAEQLRYAGTNFAVAADAEQQRSLVLRCRGQLPLGMQQIKGRDGSEAERLSGFTSIKWMDGSRSTSALTGCCYMGHANVAYEELALAASPF